VAASLQLVESMGVGFLTDAALASEHRIVVAFTTRAAGRSTGPYRGLDLAAHVGDDPSAVDDNRAALLAALGMERLRGRLTTAEQVHGSAVRVVAGATAGMGAFARPGTPPPVPDSDGLVTTETDTPLMLLFADCVPVVLVVTEPVRAVAVVHAGWRGALSGIAAEGARQLMQEAGASPSGITAYIGPHIGPCHYPVEPGLLSRFTEAFGTIVAPQGRLDLGAVVSESLNGVGVPLASQVRAGLCTAERTDAFYSHRAEGLTGRHGALACILGVTR